jgi:hypothetical protein
MCGGLCYSEFCYKVRPFVVFLASPAAYMTDQTIVVDDGATAW